MRLKATKNYWPTSQNPPTKSKKKQQNSGTLSHLLAQTWQAGRSATHGVFREKHIEQNRGLVNCHVQLWYHNRNSGCLSNRCTLFLYWKLSIQTRHQVGCISNCISPIYPHNLCHFAPNSCHIPNWCCQIPTHQLSPHRKTVVLDSISLNQYIPTRHSPNRRSKRNARPPQRNKRPANVKAAAPVRNLKGRDCTADFLAVQCIFCMISSPRFLDS